MQPKRVIIARNAAAHAQGILAGLPSAERIEVDDPDEWLRTRLAPDDFAAAKKTLVIERRRGEYLKPFPADRNLVNTAELYPTFASGCPFDCHYCYLQGYSEQAAVRIFVNPDEILAAIGREAARRAPDRLDLYGGEAADNFLLEDLTRFSSGVRALLDRHENLFVELRTKCAAAEKFSRITPHERLVIAFSMMPERHRAMFEDKTPSIAARIGIMRRLAANGFTLGVQLDPVLLVPGFESEYERLLSAVAEAGGVAEVGVGFFRCTRGLEDTIRRRFPRSQIFTGEFVVGLDGKLRYPKHRRIRAGRTMVDMIEKFLPGAKISLRMETIEVWQKVLAGRTIT